MKILGIESSHDDASVALLDNDSIVVMTSYSQIDIHAQFGGTIPEVASREHIKNFAFILEDLKSKGIDFTIVDAIAYTKEPGLLGSLQVGFLFASALAMFYNKPLIPINHLHGHFWSAAIEQNLKFPVLGLLLSGGHSQFILAKTPFNLELVGTTQDDALGEIYDKIARKLGLGFPGGPKIDKLNQEFTLNSSELINFTIPGQNPEFLLNFSFSGLKTQVINYIHKNKDKLDSKMQKNIAISFQKTIIKYLKSKINLALEIYPEIQTLTLMGGVAANLEIRQLIKSYEQLNTVVPKMQYCTDNGAMIAKAAQMKLVEENQ